MGGSGVYREGKSYEYDIWAGPVLTFSEAFRHSKGLIPIPAAQFWRFRLKITHLPRHVRHAVYRFSSYVK
jgi:hypothetical protein